MVSSGRTVRVRVSLELNILIWRWGIAGQPCDIDGTFIDSNSPPRSAPSTSINQNTWAPFESQLQFEAADFVYRTSHLSHSKIDTLLDLWAASLLEHGDTPPFADHKHLFDTIDAIDFGNLTWQSVKCRYMGERPSSNVPPWMDVEYEFCYRDVHQAARNMIGNSGFADELDYTPYREFDEKQGRRYSNVMSGDWAWKQAVSTQMIGTEM